MSDHVCHLDDTIHRIILLGSELSVDPNTLSIQLVCRVEKGNKNHYFVFKSGDAPKQVVTEYALTNIKIPPDTGKK